ncbi:MAG: nucleotide exchange factor GrpE [Methylococcaceae bacterium]|nr:nucleotide exchange factor GrpE [Methylococcaceae bacterium]
MSNKQARSAESAEELSVNTVDEAHLLEEDDTEMPELSVAELTEKLAQAELNAQENWDKMLRTQAEMENLKRRVDKDLDNTRKFALERFAKELINVIDSLELGIQASVSESPEVVKLREGSELTLKQFEATLARFNIVPVEAVGKPFNPELHQAVSTQPNGEVEPNTVLIVFQKGYLLNDRLLRPAMVVVSKAIDLPPENTPKIDEQA